MSLYVRVLTSFYTHRKTLRLRVVLGSDAFWVPPRLWAYAAENQPNGIFKDYSTEEIAMLIGYTGNAQAMLQAMLQAGFMDLEPLRIHDWEEHNSCLAFFERRAKQAAKARWDKEKERTKEREERPNLTIPNLTIPNLTIPEPSNASSMLQASSAAVSQAKPCVSYSLAIGKPMANDGSPSPSPSPEEEYTHKVEIVGVGYHSDSRTVLHVLNESTGRRFRELDCNLSVISARLKEPGVDLTGIRKMIARQCERWKGNTQEEFLRPETLFSKSKFDGYYAARDLPVSTDQPNAKPKEKSLVDKIMNNL